MRKMFKVRSSSSLIVRVLFSFLLCLFSLSLMAQETPPAILKPVNGQFYINPADSSVWQYKGVPWGWERLARHSDIVAAGATYLKYIPASFQTVNPSYSVSASQGATNFDYSGAITADSVTVYAVTIGNHATTGSHVGDIRGGFHQVGANITNIIDGNTYFNRTLHFDTIQVNFGKGDIRRHSIVLADSMKRTMLRLDNQTHLATFDGGINAANLPVSGTPIGVVNIDASGNFFVGTGSGGVVSAFNTRTGAVTLTSADVTTALGFTPVTNAGTINGKALSSNLILGLASADFANQGTVNGLLHGNGSGNPSFSGVAIADLTATGTPGSTTYLRGDNTWAGIGASGVTTVGAFSGTSKTNGASISGNTMTFGPADGTNPGLITIGTQGIYGGKTFNGPDYFTTIFNATTHPEIELDKNGVAIGYFGNGSSPFISGANDITIKAVSGNMSLEASQISFFGTVNLPNTTNFGTNTSAGLSANIFGSGTGANSNLQMIYANNVHEGILGNMGGLLISPNNPMDFGIYTDRGFEIAVGGGQDQPGVSMHIYQANGHTGFQRGGTFTDDLINQLQVTGSVAITAPETTVSGSTSGTAKFSEALQGSKWKWVTAILTSLTGTVTYTFPTPFINLPKVITANGSLVTSLSITSITITGSGTTDTVSLTSY